MFRSKVKQRRIFSNRRRVRSRFSWFGAIASLVLLLLVSELLTRIFVDLAGKPIKVNALWQIWSKGENTSAHRTSCSDWVELFTVDQRKERLCGHKRIDEADWFLQRTFYKEPPNLVECFSKVRYVCGYGLIMKRAKEEITDYLRRVDWKRYSNLAAHNCRHISMYHIERALVDGGYANS